MEKKDTENMEMKKPEEQAKPKKKKIISVVRPQNATSKEAKEFTKNQGQKKDRPSRGNGRPEGNRNGNGRSEDRPNRGNGNGGNGDRPNRNGDRPQGERRFNNNGDRPNRNGDRPQGERRFNNNGDRPNRSGDRPQGERRFGGNNGDRPNRSGDRPGGDRNNGGRSGNGERSGRPFGERSARPNGGRPGNNGGRPFAGKDDDSQNQNRRPGGDRRRTEHKSSAGDTMSLGIKKPGRDTGRKEKDKNKDSLRENKFSEDRGRGGNRPNQGHHQQSRLPKALQKPVNKPKQEAPKDEVKEITLPEKMTIRELAEKMKMQPAVIVKKLFMEGTMVTVNHEIDFEKAQEIALDYNIIAEPEEKVDVIEELLKEDEEDEKDMVPRPPVVCVMGHVDHGKTSLLDKIRDTHVIAGEAGGITQHIGASVVEINGEKITFLDTPGHEAFTAMRMRGANSTDIAILVVAADDGVMPQTIEAINHAKAAGVEIIVAVNKIDKPSANIEKVKQELSEYELIPEDWGGSTIFCPVSAHTKEGIDNLLEMILLTADVLELKANPNRKARGIVIEAELDKGRGPVATMLVQKGTLHVGDYIAVGASHGKVRAMTNSRGERVTEALPSTPVQIQGLNTVPDAGEIFMAVDNEKEARTISETYISQGKEKLLADTKQRMSLDDLYSQIQAGNLKELKIIIKADVQGSVEAVKQSLLKLSNDEVVIKCIHAGVGAINESDIILASASNAIVIGFNIRPDARAKDMADSEGVDVRLYRVIYNAIEDIDSAMKGMLDPIYEEKVIGHAEIRQTYKASGIGVIAGSYVLDGTINRNCSVRITREGNLIFEGKLASLKRFKDDVKEVKSGFECGMVFENFQDVAEEDQIEAYEMVEVPRK